MNPVVIALGGAALGLAVYHTLFKPPPQVLPGELRPDSRYLNGKTYALVAVVDPRPVAAEGQKTNQPPLTKERMADLLKVLIGQLGFSVLSVPDYRSPQDGMAFASGMPTSFVLVAKWTKPSLPATSWLDLKKSLPPQWQWLTSLAATELPIT